MGTPQDQMQTCLKTETLCDAKSQFLGNFGESYENVIGQTP